MRMPPKVVHQTLPCRVGQVVHDAALLQRLSRKNGNIGAKKTACGKIYRYDVYALWQGVAMVRGQIAVRVEQPCRPHPACLFRASSRPVQPGLGIAAKRLQTNFTADTQMSNIVLISRKHDGLQRDAELRSRLARSSQIR